MTILSKLAEPSQVVQLFKKLDYQRLLKLLLNGKTLVAALSTYLALRVVIATVFDPLKRIPGPWWGRFTSLPFDLQVVRGNCYTYLGSLHKKYGPTIRIGPKTVSITTMSDAKKLLATYKYPKSKEYESLNFMEQSIFTTSDEAYNRMRRRQVGPVFTFTSLANMEDQILNDGYLALDKKLTQLIEAGNGKAKVNYYKYFQSVTTDVIGHMIFGREIGAVPSGGHPLTQWVNDSVNAAIQTAKFPILKPIKRYLGLFRIKDYKKFMAFRDNAISDRYAQVDKAGRENVNEDILQMIIDNKESIDGKPITRLQIHAELGTMLVAGIDTTSMTMTYFLHVCTLYPHIYKKVVEEIDREFPDRTQFIRVNEGRKKLHYFTAVILEAMRYRTVVGGTFPRDSSEDGFQLSDHYIPPDHIINIFLEGIHYDERVWKDPHVFNPDRYLGPNGEEMKKEIIAFSLGVRICVGRNLAWTEIYTVLANLLREYEFEIPNDCKFGPNNIDPATGQPRMFTDKIYVTRCPENPDRDCNVVFRKRRFAKQV
ncbi:Benzoate 4-monooxygenase [Zancudomyces culisetae]|uniref:Benzoate 4-monooxygenase n=1 Tax=Zancudomyces culisetae TaxID=1213189 RepID=A0A1R1PCK6_ZANCU|nr:Benzoate 4-monooxygenase [Zancudomyces culisetae]|eukprot:OMH78704.1 Benzoate 4-monooxygenase [Zancudomyces culisetae]